jgi:hypothetical protein
MMTHKQIFGIFGTAICGGGNGTGGIETVGARTSWFARSDWSFHRAEEKVDNCSGARCQSFHRLHG